MRETEIITANTAEFLRFLKERFTLIHQSNFFFRDLQYGAIAYFESKGKKLKYLVAETVAHEVAAEFERKGIFKQIDRQTWLVQYPEFTLPRVEKKAS
jgi:hypothetical protein